MALLVSMEFFIGIILLVAFGPRIYSASNRSEYEEYFLGERAVGAEG
jgi:hypothetical protein